MGDPALGENIFQDRLLKALQSAGELRDADRLIPWFYRIHNIANGDHYCSRQMASRHLRKLSTQRVSEWPLEEQVALSECFADFIPTHKAEYAETIRRLDLDDDDPEQAAGDLHKAQSAFEAARAEAEALGSRRMLWLILAELAVLAHGRGERPAAVELWRLAAEHIAFIADHAGAAGLRESFLHRADVRATLAQAA